MFSAFICIGLVLVVDPNLSILGYICYEYTSDSSSIIVHKYSHKLAVDAMVKVDFGGLICPLGV